MRRRFKLLAVLVGVPIVLVAIAAVVVPRLVDSEGYKQEVVALVKAHTGLDLHIGGEVRLHLVPPLSLTVTDVRLASPPGFNATNLARIPWLKVELEPLALLSGRVEPRTIGITGLQVNLERDADGRGNWEIPGDAARDAGAPAGDDAGGALAALAVGGLDIRDAAIHWRGANDGGSFDVSAIDLRTGNLRGERGIEDVRLRATFPVSGVTVEARGDVALDRGGRVLAVPKLTAEFRAPAVAGLGAEGTLEAALTAKLPERHLLLSGVRASAQASGDGQRHLELDASGDVGFDAGAGRLMESTLSLQVPRYSVPGARGSLALRGVLSGDLLAGEYTFHGMEGDGTLAGEAIGGAHVVYTLSGRLHGDVDRRKLSASGLTLAGGIDGAGGSATGSDRLPFTFTGGLELSGRAGTLTATDMDLQLDDWSMDGGVTLRATPAPAGIQGVLDVRIQEQPVAGSFAAMPSATVAGAMDLRADMVVDLDIERDDISLRGRNAIVLRANLGPGDADGHWRIADLDLGARLTDASLPGGELSVRLSADVDVDMTGEIVRSDNLRASVDKSRIAGSLEVRGFDAPAVRVDLEADAIDADRLRLPIGAPTGKPAQVTPVGATIEAIRALDVVGELRVGKLTLNGVVMENVRLTSGSEAGGR